MRKLLLGLFCFFAVFCSWGAGFAQGLDRPLIAESKYFSVYCDRSIDIYALFKKLSFEYLVYGENSSRSGDDLRTMLVKSLDSIYLSVSDVLDIHIYSYHGKIVVFPDRNALNDFLKESYELNLGERSYYFHDENTIYVSFADLAAGVLGHEMGHAIVSRYFVVPPPAKVQEILCGYVEYNLRKGAATEP